MYELKFSSAAQKYFKKLKEKGLRTAYEGALQEIGKDPYSGTVKVGALAGLYGYDVYYNKTNYEIAYRIYEEEGKTVVVILAGTRENFYHELKRYMK